MRQEIKILLRKEIEYQNNIYLDSPEPTLPSTYLVRAEHDGGMYPGTFLPEEGVVDIPVEGEVISKSEYQVDIPSSVVVIWRT